MRRDKTRLWMIDEVAREYREKLNSEMVQDRRARALKALASLENLFRQEIVTPVPKPPHNITSLSKEEVELWRKKAEYWISCRLHEINVYYYENLREAFKLLSYAQKRYKKRAVLFLVSTQEKLVKCGAPLEEFQVSNLLRDLLR
ncbi:MAG: hypothetical protein C4292_02330 [Nitrososphaera sp.]